YPIGVFTIPLNCFQRETSQHSLRDNPGNKWLDLLTDDYDEGNGYYLRGKPPNIDYCLPPNRRKRPPQNEREAENTNKGDSASDRGGVDPEGVHDHL
ncbi:MAG: hypothetical protein ACFFC7_12530, partial [Candidatus Hermodarchaeota archaeon]